jgi:hypothetical protein
MLHLLTKTSIFIQLPNECLCQLTGEPLIYQIPPKLDGCIPPSDSETYNLGKRKRHPLECPGPRKRLKVVGLKDFRRVFPESLTIAATISSERCEEEPPLLYSTDNFIRRTASDVSFVRARVFYARPNREPKLQYLIVGLPHTRKHLSKIKNATID